MRRLSRDIGNELRYALRTLRRSPGFMAVGVLTLAIGIGATTAIYSVVDTILLQPLPFPDSDRLVRVIEHVPPPAPGRPVFQRGVAYHEFVDWRTRATTLIDAVAIVPMAQRMVQTEHVAAGLWGAMTTVDLFARLGVQAMLGRVFVPDDAAQPDVVLLSFETWRRHYNANPDVVGTAREFRPGALQSPAPARLLTIVGVLPADFELPTGPLDFYTPIASIRRSPYPR